MNHIVKSIVVACGLALSVMIGGCTTEAPPPPQAEAASALNGPECAAFCRTEGGPFYVSTSANSLSACTSSGGDWFTSDQGYGGPPPGCCCKCARPGSCL